MVLRLSGRAGRGQRESLAMALASIGLAEIQIEPALTTCPGAVPLPRVYASGGCAQVAVVVRSADERLFLDENSLMPPSNVDAASRFARGYYGEYRLERDLSTLSDDYQVVYGLSITIDGNTYDCDALVSGPTGTWIIDAKCWKNELAINHDYLAEVCRRTPGVRGVIVAHYGEWQGQRTMMIPGWIYEMAGPFVVPWMTSQTFAFGVDMRSFLARPAVSDGLTSSVRVRIERSC